MKHPHPSFSLCLLAGSLLGLAALAEQPKTTQPGGISIDLKKRLELAEASGALERARLRNEAESQDNLAKRAETARVPAPSPMERARALAENTQLDNVISKLSPDGRQILEETPAPSTASTAPPGRLAQAAGKAPGGQASPAMPPPAPSSPGAPQPQPLKPASLQDPSLSLSKTVITCSGSSFFDANKAIGIFTGDVRVYHPQFYLECDDLEIFMKKPDKSQAEKSGQPAGEASNGDSPDEQSSIDKVIARGSMVTIEKFTENGQDIQVGKCKQLTYDGTTGIVTLRIWPQIQRGAHLQIADEASTIMTITPEGHFKSSNGRTRTEILQGADAKPKTKGLRRAPEQ